MRNPHRSPAAFATGAALFGLLTPLHATILSVASSSASSQFETHNPSLTTNASGISAPLTSESLLLVAGHDNDGNANTMWHSAVVAASGQYLIWNFSSASTLRSIYYWNHNQNNLSNRGIKDVDILISKDNGATYTSVGVFTLIQAAGVSGERAHTIELPTAQTGVTNVKFNIQSNFGGNVVGLSEIRFSDTTVPVPAPAVSLSATPAIVVNGSQTSLAWTAENTSSVSISPGVGSVAATGSTNLTPPSSADTVYTITGTAGSNTATATQTVRSVPGGLSTYRYVRFTPKKFRGAGNSVQIAEMYFYKTAGGLDKVVPVSVTNDGGSNPVGQEADKIIDGSTTTKWLDFNKKGLTFDFGEGFQGFREYQFVSGGDAPERDAVQWTIEGANDINDVFTLIENVTAFDYPIPTTRTATTALIPLPGSYINALRPKIEAYTLKRETALPELTTYLDWTVSGATRITVKAGSGAEQDVTNAGGHLEIPPPTAATTYTLTAYSSTNVATSASLSAGAPPATLPTTISYPDFSKAGQELILNGPAWVMNDALAMPAAGDKMRLRVVPDTGSQNGSAWFHQKVPVSGGIDTTFGLQLATNARAFGAEGLAFIIQNTAEGTALLPAQTGPLGNAVTVEFSTWNNNAANEVPAETNWEAQIRVYKGTGTERTAVGNVNLRNTGLADTLRGESLATLTGDYSDTPYQVHLTYSASGVLDVYMDGFHVLNGMSVPLGDAADEEGKAYVGFASSTGGYWQASDITSWTLTSGAAGTPLKITASSINPATGALSLTWSSTAGKTYRIAGSADLTNWATALKTGIAATAGSTTSSTTFAPGAVRFFRVEEE